jgi:predicted nuclease of predicted toxin-antitoxin system
MHPFRFPLLADENIHEDTVHFLRLQGLQVQTIRERNLRGSSDRQIIDLAVSEKKVVLTHDADFGRIFYLSQEFQTGIIFLRPGHANPAFTQQTIQAIMATELEAVIPFILVAERTNDDIKIRLRNL